MKKFLIFEAKTGEKRIVDVPVYQTYADLPKDATDGRMEYVEETKGLIGLRKHAGLYVHENGKWQLLEKADA